MAVLTFKRTESPVQWIAGRARCAVCGHKHIAVATVGTEWLRCPECKLYKARFVHALLPMDNTVAVCSCGCDVFHIVKEGFFCIHCGKTQRF